LKLLHGSLFDVKCFSCPVIIKDIYDDPFHRSLAITSDSDDRLDPSRKDPSTTTESSLPTTSTSNTETIDPSTLPHCPQCKTGLLRPGVVWFNEQLPLDTLSEIDTWIAQGPIDIILVIGTTATVWPAAGYVEEARAKGARVAVINWDSEELGSASELGSEDFLFLGDAAEIVPELLKSVIGDEFIDVE
jgi:NAD-dependent deacetylase sirtuin 5